MRIEDVAFVKANRTSPLHVANWIIELSMRGKDALGDTQNEQKFHSDGLLSSI